VDWSGTKARQGEDDGGHQAPSFALAVPTRHAVAIIPIPLRQKLGIE